MFSQVETEGFFLESKLWIRIDTICYVYNADYTVHTIYYVTLYTLRYTLHYTLYTIHYNMYYTSCTIYIAQKYTIAQKWQL